MEENPNATNLDAVVFWRDHTRDNRLGPASISRWRRQRERIDIDAGAEERKRLYGDDNAGLGTSII